MCVCVGVWGGGLQGNNLDLLAALVCDEAWGDQGVVAAHALDRLKKKVVGYNKLPLS